MRKEDHPNYVPKNHITLEDHERIWAHTTEQALAERRAKEFAQEWPGTAIKAILALHDRVTTLETRLAQLEARAG
jgi:hypothetical protein